MFGNRSGELHGRNDNDRGVIETRQESVSEWVPMFGVPSHLGVFGGEETVRNAVVLQSIANCYGNMGIVVLHFNDNLIRGIKGIRQSFPELESAPYVDVCAVDSANPIYEPLFGVSAERAVEMIYPQVNRDNPSYLQMHICAEALRGYFRIIEFNSMEIDIDALLYFVNMDLSTLEECEEWQRVPEMEQSKIMASFLHHDNIFLQVRADVNSFAEHLKKRIWDTSDEKEEATDISMVSAVRDKKILTIKVPFNNHVTDYLATELQAIMEEGLEFLLVIDSVYVAPSLLNSEILKMPVLPFSTIYACENIRGIFGDNQSDVENILAKLDLIHIMRCNNIIAAQPYSAIVGQYLRNFESTHIGSHREKLELLGGVDKSVDRHEELFDRIRPEEFVALGNGAVLIDQSGVDNVTIKTELFTV